MRFGILGTGVVGKTIAARLAGLGHDVIVGTRTPAEASGSCYAPEWFRIRSSTRPRSFSDDLDTRPTLPNSQNHWGECPRRISLKTSVTSPSPM